LAKQKLGRGLGAILDDVEEAYRSDVESGSSGVKEIYIDDIKPNIFQPRKHFNQEALESLSQSIKKHGLLQPIVVVQKDDAYMIIAGERRFRASKLAGLDKIEAIVADFQSQNLRELALIENIQREDLNPIELASSYKELIGEYNITQEELSDIICKSRSHIANTMRLLNLSQYTQDMLIKGKITQGHAKVLVGLDQDGQKLIVDTVIGQKLSVRECEDLIKKIKQNSSNKGQSIQKDNLQSIKVKELQNRLSGLGYRVKGSKNKLSIEFKNEEEAGKFLEFFS
jgi:ParB family chromosome partitioning protein